MARPSIAGFACRERGRYGRATDPPRRSRLDAQLIPNRIRASVENADLTAAKLVSAASTEDRSLAKETLCRRQILARLGGAALVASLPPGLAKAAAADAPAAGTPGQRLVVQFHSNFLLNLHHFLVDAGRHAERLDNANWVEAPQPAEMRALQDSASFYAQNYAERGLLFDEELHDIKEKLSGPDDRIDPAGLGLPQGVESALATAAPIFQHCLWPAHDQSNRRWIVQVQALDEVYGAEIQAEIERYLAHRFIAEPVRFDAVFETGDRNGAYTSTEPPHTVMPSSRAGYHGLAALEMLYHETSHIHVTDTIRTLIDAQIDATGRHDDGGLWHAVQFYTVGAVAQQVLRRRGNLDYRPYAEVNGVYGRTWAIFPPLLTSEWQSYLDGKIEMADAIKVMVAQLPA
jgi:hypothetical protein